MKIAVFDVCGTLYKSNTTFDFLDYYFEGNRSFSVFRYFSQSILGKLVDYPLRKYFNFDIIRTIALMFLKGEEEKVVEKSAKYFVLENLESKINHPIVDLLNSYKNQGYVIVLMSGSLDCLIDQVALRFESDAYFSSKLLSINGILQGSLSEDLLFNKRDVLINSYPSIKNLVVVTDNLTDLNLVKFSNEAHVLCHKEKHKQFWIKQNLPQVEVIT